MHASRPHAWASPPVIFGGTGRVGGWGWLVGWAGRVTLHRVGYLVSPLGLRVWCVFVAG